MRDVAFTRDSKLRAAQDYLVQGLSTYRSSIYEALGVKQMYDNIQYTPEQLAQLADDERPAETFNIIKKYTRNLVGYMSTVTTDIRIMPNAYKYIDQAKLYDVTVQDILAKNNWPSMSLDIFKEVALSGLVGIKYTVEDTKETDSVGRPVYNIKIGKVKAEQIVSDPLDTSYDYSTARYTHELTWMPETELSRLFGTSKLKFLSENLGTDVDSDFGFAALDVKLPYITDGRFKRHKHYLVVRSVLKRKDGRYDDLYWCNNILLKKSILSYNPYRVYKLNSGEVQAGFYGIFHDIIETQKAINQALLQIQLLVNTNKVFVEENAVDDLQKFTEQYNRVNGIVSMLDMNGYKVENLSADVIAQYNIIDSGIQRIQAILGINDSFLGLAAASDSGRKVSLQQNSSVVALKYFTNFVEQAFARTGEDLVKLVQEFYVATRDIPNTRSDDDSQQFITVNKPFAMPVGLGDDGEIVYENYSEPVLDSNNMFVLDANNNIQVKHINEPDSDLQKKIDFSVKADAQAYGEHEEVEKVMLEAMVNGNPGMLLQQLQPGLYAKLLVIYAKALKSEHSTEIIELFKEVERMTGVMPPKDPRETPEGEGQGRQLGNMSANSGAITHALGVTNSMANDGYNKGQ